MYIGPDTIAGLSVSLNMVFAVIAGGMWTLFGPTFGAVFTQVLTEGLRLLVQSDGFKAALAGFNRFMAQFFIGFEVKASSMLTLDSLIYGLLLILFIIYMPRGILGSIIERWQRPPRP
jgi:branched-chain amino acid transport system permease protein